MDKLKIRMNWFWIKRFDEEYFFFSGLILCPEIPLSMMHSSNIGKLVTHATFLHHDDNGHSELAL